MTNNLNIISKNSESSGHDPIQVDEGYVTIVELIVCNSENVPTYKYIWYASDHPIPAFKDGFWVVRFGLGGSGYKGHWNTNDELMSKLPLAPASLKASDEDRVVYYDNLEAARNLKKFGSREAAIAQLKIACDCAISQNNLRKSGLPNLTENLLKKKDFHKITWQNLGFKQ